MKMIDNHQRVTIELTHLEAEKLFRFLYQVNMNIKDLPAIKVADKLMYNLDEYLNS